MKIAPSPGAVDRGDVRWAERGMARSERRLAGRGGPTDCLDPGPRDPSVHVEQGARCDLRRVSEASVGRQHALPSRPSGPSRCLGSTGHPQGTLDGPAAPAQPLGGVGAVAGETGARPRGLLNARDQVGLWVPGVGEAGPQRGATDRGGAQPLTTTGVSSGCGSPPPGHRPAQTVAAQGRADRAQPLFGFVEKPRFSSGDPLLTCPQHASTFPRKRLLGDWTPFAQHNAPQETLFVVHERR